MFDWSLLQTIRDLTNSAVQARANQRAAANRAERLAGAEDSARGVASHADRRLPVSRVRYSLGSEGIVDSDSYEHRQ